jgi:hypothetical protein
LNGVPFAAWRDEIAAFGTQNAKERTPFAVFTVLAVASANKLDASGEEIAAELIPTEDFVVAIESSGTDNGFSWGLKAASGSVQHTGVSKTNLSAIYHPPDSVMSPAAFCFVSSHV